MAIESPLNVFFDVDETLVLGDGRLRPHTREAFEAILAMGHVIYVWSGVGIRTWDMKRHGLHDLVHGYFVKPLSEYRARLDIFNVQPTPDFVVDDIEAVVEAFGGYHIHTDIEFDDDHQLLEVVERIRELSAVKDASHA